MKKRIVCILTVAALIYSLCTQALAYQIVGLSNFEKTSVYSTSVFSDNPTSKWYYSNVATVYEYGLMNGTGNNKFNPTGNIKLSETVAVAVRINCTYFSGGVPELESEDGDSWYSPYVRLAKRKGIIEKDYTSYTVNATRAEFAKILAASIDEVDLEPINIVDDGAIPDVDMKSDYADAVYLLYRAGVLTGSDSVGSFKPDSTITRAEAAAIITRIIDPTLRQTVELVGEY